MRSIFIHEHRNGKPSRTSKISHAFKIFVCQGQSDVGWIIEPVLWPRNVEHPEEESVVAKVNFDSLPGDVKAGAGGVIGVQVID